MPFGVQPGLCVVNLIPLSSGSINSSDKRFNLRILVAVDLRELK